MLPVLAKYAPILFNSKNAYNLFVCLLIHLSAYILWQIGHGLSALWNISSHVRHILWTGKTKKKSYAKTSELSEDPVGMN